MSRRGALLALSLGGVLLQGILHLPAEGQSLTGGLPPGGPGQLSPFDPPPTVRPDSGPALSSEPVRRPQLGREYGLIDQQVPGAGMSSGLPPPGAVAPREIDGTITHQFVEPGVGTGPPICGGEYWTWQVVPEGLLFPSYLAGGRESRLGTQWVYVRDHGWFWDSTLGGRAGLLRYGTEDCPWPEGWQLDVEAAAFPRLDLEAGHDLTSADFRVGVPLTFRRGKWEGKFGYYHLSSHLGDEFQLANPAIDRINYVRDSLVLGFGLRPWRDLRLYGEVGYALYTDGGAKPWEFQFGAEYSSVEPTCLRGSPFVAANCHLRQENDFGGNVAIQTGWQWRGQTGHLMRVGAQYFSGLSDQYQFFSHYEDQVGVGLWYDF
jgi:hypothetical protein